MRYIFYLAVLLAITTVSAQQKQLSLEDAIWGRYTYLNPTSHSFKWKNNDTFTSVKNDTLWAESAKTGAKSPIICLKEINKILAETEFELKGFPGYDWLENGNLLITSRGRYFAVDLEEKKLKYKIELPAQASEAVFNAAGGFVAYVIENDLFVSFADGERRQITSDGGNGIVNGKTVHRSEYGIQNGIFISPNGKFIAFYRKDESMVKDYPLVDFMARQAEHTPVKYPMAGMNSEQVSVGVYTIETAKTRFLNTGEPLDHYLTNIAWSPDEKNIYMAELNRQTNHLFLNCYDITSGEKTKTLFEVKNDAYVEPLYPIEFSKVNQNEFYYLSRKDGWFHIYKYNTAGELLQQITKGEWEVCKILGFDAAEKHVFIEATIQSPLENHICKVEVKTGKIQLLNEITGVHHGSLSPGAGYILNEWEAPDNPGTTEVLSTNGKIKRTLFTKENTLKDYQLGENKLVDILSADGKTMLTGRIVLPVDFDATKKYPVVVYVYGGPHSQLVTKSWHNGARWWQYYMASKGYIAFTMDNRGTNNRGRVFETAIHRELGVKETEDQMKGIEYLKSLPYVDGERIGVHGWSYGGFMTLNLMLRHPDIFKVGVAGGPVVDWSMYEIMYGERYMDTPEENPEGYEKTNMVNYVSSLDGKLMLIHGVQDETVVMQHSMKFIRECVKQGKQVDFFPYPTHPHNVRGKERVHLMEMVSNYFFVNL